MKKIRNLDRVVELCAELRLNSEHQKNLEKLFFKFLKDKSVIESEKELPETRLATSYIEEEIKVSMDKTNNLLSRIEQELTPIKCEGWVNIRPDRVLGCWFASQKDAVKQADGDVIATIRIEWEY